MREAPAAIDMDGTPQSLVRRIDLRNPHSLAELFLLANLSFLAIDIYIAHSMNAFAHWAEWIPFGYSLAAPLLLVLSISASRPRDQQSRDEPRPSSIETFQRRLGMFVCGAGVLVGVAGLLWHLDSSFFEERTVENLVYAAPFAAPLSYAGLGLLGLLNRMVPAPSVSWARWVVTLALGGFVGNFVLSLADHAQNGFFDWREWIAVVAAAVGCGSLAAVLLFPRDEKVRRFGLAVMLLQIAAGLAGFAFHVAAIIDSPMSGWWEKLLYSAPAFAPLLFCNLALLAMLGIWSIGLCRSPNKETAYC